MRKLDGYVVLILNSPRMSSLLHENQERLLFRYYIYKQSNSQADNPVRSLSE